MHGRCAPSATTTPEPFSVLVKQAISLQPAYLLHYTQYQESSFIVDFVTLDHGRVSMLARGARSGRSRSRALYQPFRPLLVSWMGSRELRTLTGIEDSGAALDFDDRALACAYYINELMLRLVGKDQPQPELFAHYVMALSALSAPDDAPSALEITLRHFELQLLDAVGLLPAFHAEQGAPAPDGEYRFFPASARAIRLDAPSGVREPIPDTLRWRDDGTTEEDTVDVSGSTLIALQAQSLDGADARILDEAKSLMRRLIRLHLGGRPLQSRSLFPSLAPNRMETGDD